MQHLPLTPPAALAISAIRQYFDIWSLPQALQQTSIIFKKAAGKKAWRPANPYYAVHCCRHLQRLSKAAFVLGDHNHEAFVNAILVKPADNMPDLSQPLQQFTGKGRQDDAFSNFPRQLSAIEYGCPTDALRSYCSYRSKKNWKQFYRLLAECSLSTLSLQEYEKAGKLFGIRSQVFKLIEACHLLHVRLRAVQIVLE